jgi:3-hydroxyisobutyrate dehydrogenase-like beta-hydroxyacid dehydrogenase
MRVAFIGIGQMAIRLADGNDLVLYNRTRAVADELAAEIGARSAGSPREASDGADVVITMLPDIDVLRDVYSGEAGVAAGLQTGAIALDMGTTGPAGVSWLERAVQAVGSSLVDAPVSGSTVTAAEGTLTILAGGPQDAFEQVRPLLDAMGSRVYHLGPTGSGAAMKLAVNAVIYALGQAISESLVLAERFGIDSRLAYDVFENSAVAAPMVKYRHDQYLDPDGAPVLFAMALAEKDLRLIGELASTVKAVMPQARVNLESYAQGVASGFGEGDMAALAQYLRTLGGEDDVPSEVS